MNELFFIRPALPTAWQNVCGAEAGRALNVLAAVAAGTTLPLDFAHWFRAFATCAPGQVHVVIIGQDPYPNRQHAMGLAFSVPAGIALPRSLANIYKELTADLGTAAPPDGDLSRWAAQGVLLANSALTVQEGSPDSHAGVWAEFTEAWVGFLGSHLQPRVWILWGAKAKRFRSLIGPHHIVIESAHPSPLSARRGFFGSRPFSRANAALAQLGYAPICWT